MVTNAKIGRWGQKRQTSTKNCHFVGNMGDRVGGLLRVVNNINQDGDLMASDSER